MFQPFYVAIVYAGLGEMIKLWTGSKKRMVTTPTQFVFLKVDPELDTLRSRPRFHELQAQAAPARVNLTLRLLI